MAQEGRTGQSGQSYRAVIRTVVGYLVLCNGTYRYVPVRFYRTGTRYLVPPYQYQFAVIHAVVRTVLQYKVLLLVRYCRSR